MFGFGKRKQQEDKEREEALEARKEEIKNGFMPVYNVQLLYSKEPKLKVNNIINRIKKYCGEIDLITGDGNKEMIGIAFKEHCVTYKDNQQVPSQGIITQGSFELDLDKMEGSLQQSWSFREAEQVVKAAKYQIIITDLMAGGLEYKERLNLFQGMVRAVLDETDCIAISWNPSNQFIEPKKYLNCIADDLLNAAINVRFYNISNGDNGEMLMDTVGLAALGIPDLQCHFYNLDPDSIASMLYNTAYYIYEKGDVIEDGHTVQGIKPEDKWKCQHEMSLVSPERIVLDINPGKGFAAGNRE
jgi:hypothetical protein